MTAVVCKFVFFFHFLTAVISKDTNVREPISREILHQRRARETGKRLSNVVSHAFCESSLPAEDKMGKETLDEIHTYAELKHDPRASLPDSFTICSTISVTSCPNYAWPAFFTILDNDRAQLLAPVSNRDDMVSYLAIFYLRGESEEIFGKIPPLFPNQWTSSCMAINTKSGLIHWVVEGTLVLTTISKEVQNSKSRPKDLSKKLVIGARSYAGVWKAPSGKVTNLNIYSSALSIEHMERMTKRGGCVEDGDYLAWRDMEWILHGQAEIQTVDQEETCQGHPYVNLYYTRFPNMDACMHHCQKLGTKVPSVTNSEDWAVLQRYLKMEFYDTSLYTLQLWLPIEDRKTEGEWSDFYTGSVMQNYSQPWAGSKSDGGIEQNCAYLFEVNTWSYYGCDSPYFACMCTNKPSSYLEFKGLCPGSAIDVHYKPINDLKDSRKLKLQGLKGTSIRFDNKQEMWLLNMKDSNMTGMSRATHASFTLGKHNWTIEGDKGCNQGKSYVTELKMSGCQKKEFTCNDGQCVNMDQRCNQLPDCRDESDENNYNVLVLKHGYNKNVPPTSTAYEKVNISVSINLLKLVDIDEDDYSIEIQFKITLHWKENRATYHNLKENDNLNALTQHDIETLWLPNMIYENTDQKETTRLGEFGNGEWKTKVVVIREGNSSAGGPEMVDETQIFKGSENMLAMSQTYTHKFQCQYELSNYPFDTQTCSIDMAMGSLDTLTVNLVPDQLKIMQKLNMPIFRIVDWGWQSKISEDGEKGISMVFVMKRKITSEMMTTYFPSILLTAITFATTFFKPFFFEAALSVNLTTMLVMTTIFISKMEGLPPTSDIKMIDIWLVLCQMVPFAEVILLTAMEYQREDQSADDIVATNIVAVSTITDEEEEENMHLETQWGKRVMHWFPQLKTIERKVMPALVLASFIIYFVLAAIFYYDV